MKLQLAIAIALLAVPAVAAETAWQEIAPDVRLRLIASDVRDAGGKTLIGLEIDMPSNTKTYWRVPGETGIATEIDTSASAGVSGHKILWPYPTVDKANGYLDYVYWGPTVLPIELEVEPGGVLLDAAVTMGLCSDICVPAMAKFSLPLSFDKPDNAQAIRLNQALALTPVEWEGPQEAIGDIGITAARDGLWVKIGHPSVEPASVIADMGPAGALFGTPQKSPDGTAVLLPLLGGSDSEGLEGKPVQLTFQTRMGPFETSRRILPASSATH